MLSWLMNTVLACWNPVDRCVRSADDVADSQDALLWYKDLDRHAAGQYSMAVVQANQLMEDYSQVESGSSYGTFVGVYDGHGGPEAAKFIKRHLFSHFMQFTLEDGGVSVEVLQKAIRATEEGFERLVTESWSDKPQIAAVGSCCLVGAISGDTLYIANVGDSRAVMGSVLKTTEAVFPLQLTIEHNASIEAVRQELKSLHPDDAHIVVLKHGVWRVKGIIQVSRSIGDFYLKKQEFNREPLFARFRIAEPLKRPILTAEPAIVVHKIKLQEDQFVIFASDGLWEHLSNEEAVEIVHKYPRSGIARRLIRTALQEAAKKREMRYIDLKKIDRGIRRHFHDDITVIVIFFDHELIGKPSVCSAVRSVREVDHSFSPALHSSVNLSPNGHYAANGCYL